MIIPLPTELATQDITQYTLHATFTAWAPLVGCLERSLPAWLILLLMLQCGVATYLRPPLPLGSRKTLQNQSIAVRLSQATGKNSHTYNYERDFKVMGRIFGSLFPRCCSFSYKSYVKF